MKEAFYDQLQSTLDQCPVRDTVLVMGHFNASTGTGRDGYEEVMVLVLAARDSSICTGGGQQDSPVRLHGGPGRGLQADGTGPQAPPEDLGGEAHSSLQAQVTCG